MPSPAASRFQTTRWSVVLHARDSGDPAASAALDQLCRLYWRPLYVFSRGQGRSPEDAEDLTQTFFAQLLARDSLRLADPTRGRFRSFLLVAFKNHQTDAHRRARAERRGGGTEHLDLETAALENELSSGPASSPERDFDRQWARDLVRRVTDALRDEYRQAGRLDWYERVAGEQAGTPYAELAVELGTTEDALKSFALRVRRRFRTLLEREVADTVATPDELPGEMAYLAELLRG